MRNPAAVMLVLLSASACAAEPAPADTGHAGVDAFIADIAADRREAAIARISSIESLTGSPNAAETPTEFVDKLLSCSFSSSSERRLGQTGPVTYNTTWQCPDGEYWAFIDPDYRPPQLTIGQFVSTATRNQWRSAAPPVAVVPPQTESGKEEQR